MKLTLLITLLATMHVSASLYSQGTKLDISVKGMSVKEVLKMVESKSSYRFFYSDDFQALDRTVSFNMEKSSLENVLNTLLDQTTASYRILENNIVVISPFSLQQKKITGTVTDATTGEPIPGVNILIEGTTLGTVTTGDGRYSLDVPNSNSVLLFSYIGYISERIELNGNSSVDLKLVPDVKNLEEVVVIGYGTVRKSDLTGSVGSVKADDIKNQPLTRIDQALQGNVPGVVVNSNGGQPGGTIRVRIRGANSITGPNDPLYIIDGFIGGDISSMNVNDIESMEILKDASSTAIYGSRGANGVVLISTKTGKAGATRIDFGTFISMNQLAKKLDLMNAYEFASTINSSTTNPPFSNSDLERFKTQSTDWQDEIYRKALSKNYQLSLSGGNKDIRYFISGNYSDQAGILINSNYNRLTLRSNIDANLSSKIAVKLNLSGSRSNGHNNTYDGWKQQPAAQAPVWDPTVPVFNTDGTYNLKSNYGSIWNQPVAVAEAAKSDNTLDDFIGNLSFNYNIVEGLKLTINGAVEVRDFLRRSLYTPYFTSGNTNGAEFQNDRNILFQNSNILSYTKTFNDIHNVTISAIYEQQSSKYDNLKGSSNEMISAGAEYYNFGLGTQSLGSYFSNEKIQSYLGRINYSLLDRYLLTATFRTDGSSKFSKENRYSSFPSVAFAWRMSEESFMKNQTFISDLKIRTSYGKTGNQAISPYKTLSLMNTGTYYVWDGKTKSPGVSIGAPANPGLKWETTTTQNLGMDISLLNGSLSLNLDVYNKKTTDLLLAVPLPQFMGGDTYLKNIGSVQNQGIEVNISAVPFSKKNFKWTTSFNITSNRNEVLDLGEGTKNIPAGTGTFNGANPTYMIIEGESLGNIWGNKSLGTWKSSEAAEALKFGAKPGQEKLLDLNNDYKINGDDMMVLGNSMPKYTFGFNNDFTYKNLTLNLFITSMQGFKVWNVNNAYTMGGQGDARNATNRDYLNRWTSGNQTDIPTDNQYIQSSRFVEDGSFIRIKNINLTYHFPKSAIDRLRMKSLDLFISGQNLLTFTKYTGYDPESTSTFANSGGDAVGPMDWGTIPNPRVYTIGLKVGL